MVEDDGLGIETLLLLSLMPPYSKFTRIEKEIHSHSDVDKNKILRFSF